MDLYNLCLFLIGPWSCSMILFKYLLFRWISDSKTSDFSCLKAQAHDGAVSVTITLGSPNCLTIRLKNLRLPDWHVSYATKHRVSTHKNQLRDINNAISPSPQCKFHPFAKSHLPCDFVFSKGSRQFDCILEPIGIPLYDRRQFYVHEGFIKHHDNLNYTVDSSLRIPW